MTVLATLGLFLAAIAPPELARAGAPGLAAIEPAALSAHIRFLADDLLEGRAPGTPGHALAARYLAAQLQAAGLEPAGEKGTWFQTVPLLALKVDPARCTLRIDSPSPGWTLSPLTEAIVAPAPARPVAAVSGELVFAGFGVAAPPYRYDDVPRDLRGKIAVVLSKAPLSDRDDFFPLAASAVYGDGNRKARLLAERGAVAVIAVAAPESLEGYPWEKRVRHNAAFEKMYWLEGDTPGSGSPVPVASITPEAFARILQAAGRKETLASLTALGKSGKLRPFALGLRATVQTGATVRRLASENVIGIVRGSDPERAREHVAFSAHLDHLGRGPAVAGDDIYNGAVDDAAGVAGLIEIAGAFAALPKRPPRSILFLGVTAEEKGLLGSDYFVHHPTVPLASIVADVNSDAPLGWWTPRDVVALGAEHSSLDADVRAAATALGLSVSPDPNPEEVFFIRSDQYSFVKQGIPSVFPSVGQRDDSGDTKAHHATMTAWIKEHYHQPSDEWNPKLDYASMAVEVRFYFLIGLSVALDPARPAWTAGDVFGQIFPPPAK